MKDKQCFKCEHYCAAVNLDMRWCELGKSMEAPCNAYKEVISEPVYTSATTVSTDNFKNIMKHIKKTYYVTKDGRCVSDYDNIEDAQHHAEQIEGEVAARIAVLDDNAAININLSKNQYELLIDAINERFLPCPFCGEKPRVVGVFNGDDDDEFTTVKLLHENENCPAAQWIDEKEGMVELDKLDELIEWWNQRHF